MKIVDAYSGIEDGKYFICGRVLVYHGLRWGSVCHDESFNDKDALVLCRMGFFTTDGKICENTTSTTTVSWLTHLNCYGSETDVSSCPGDMWSLKQCKYPDATIKCFIDTGNL